VNELSKILRFFLFLLFNICSPGSKIDSNLGIYPSPNHAIVFCLFFESWLLLFHMFGFVVCLLLFLKNPFLDFVRFQDSPILPPVLPPAFDSASPIFQFRADTKNS
jgi:hypothetical protein